MPVNPTGRAGRKDRRKVRLNRKVKKMTGLRNRRESIVFMQRPAPVPPNRRWDIHPVAAAFAFAFTSVAAAAVLWAPLPRAYLMVYLVLGMTAAPVVWFGSRTCG